MRLALPQGVTGNIVPALLAAVLWGVGDFSGGMGVKRAGASLRAALVFVLLSHTTSFLVLMGIALHAGTPFPHGAPLVWGLVAGLSGGAAILAFYLALTRGAMGAAASISGLLAAAIPALVSAVLEGAPGLLKVFGFVIAGVAIWLIGSGSAGHAERSAALLAILAGAGFGLYFVALRFASPSGAVWSMLIARVGSITLCAALLVTVGLLGSLSDGNTVPLHFPRQAGWWVLLTALFDTAGNLLFVLATRTGRLDVAAVLASLYPASTILLAATLLKERPTRRQAIGMLTALAAVVLVAL